MVVRWVIRPGFSHLTLDGRDHLRHNIAGMEMTTPGYGDDLAYIHEAGFADFAKNAAPEILRILRGKGIAGGLVIDIGCGTGVLTEELVAAGYRVLGIDISPSMLKIARKRVPAAAFRAASFLDARLPACDAITSVGECINYRLDPSNTSARLESFFARAYRALRPGGVLVFDFLEPTGAATRAGTGCRIGRDWAVLIERVENRSRNILTRHITAFRRIGLHYRRTDETHHLKLYSRDQICAMLRRIGFSVRIFRGYGAVPLSPGHTVVVARRRA
jgi:SAM-dependent methyltransferase